MRYEIWPAWHGCYTVAVTNGARLMAERVWRVVARCTSREAAEAAKRLLEMPS